MGPTEQSLSSIKKVYTDSVNGRPKDEGTPLIGAERRERFDDRVGNFISNSKSKAPSRKELNEPSMYAPEIIGLASMHRSHDSRRNLHGLSTLKVPTKDSDFMSGGTRLQPIVSTKGGFNDKRLSERTADQYQNDGLAVADRGNSVEASLLLDDIDVIFKPSIQKTTTLCSDLSMQNLQQSTYILDAPVKRSVRPHVRDTISDVSSMAQDVNGSIG